MVRRDPGPTAMGGGTPPSRSRGFTLVELAVILAILGILSGLAAWQVSALLPGYRVGHAARRFLADVRFAPSIAARTNEPVHLVVDPASDCGPSWTLVTGASPESPTRVLDRICLDAEAPGVAMANGGVTHDVGCPQTLGPDLPNCSLCEKGARLTFYPTGETVAVKDGAEIDGHSIVFTPRASPTARDTLAVGIRAGTGDARLFRPHGDGWECP
jgi:prepilin-type N-terminal cleavage/methylation domain-containing protein